MQAGRKRTVIGAAIALVVLIADAPAAMAQLVQSDVESETPTPETSQLVTSSTEVRRAVIGLIALAVLVGLLGIWYWYKTGKQAADRHAHKFGGRHHGRAGEPTRAAGAPVGTAAHAVGAPSSMAAQAAVPGSGAASPRRVPPGGVAAARDTWATPGQSTLAPSLMADPGLTGTAGFVAGYGAASPHAAASPSSSVFSPAPWFGARGSSTASVFDPHVSAPTWSTAPELRPGGTSTATGATQLPVMSDGGRSSSPSEIPARASAPASAGQTGRAPAPASAGQTGRAPAPASAGQTGRAPAAPQRAGAVDSSVARRAPASPRSGEAIGPSRRGAGSPYPDGAAPGAQQVSEGRWATLRRDLFG